MQTPTFITGNAQKVEDLQRFLGVPMPHRKLDIAEIQSLNLRNVVTAKARAAFSTLGTPVLVEDTSLRIPALGRLPGPLVKWFLQELGNEGLCRLVPPGASREAIAETAYATYDGDAVQVFEGSIRGRILESPDGGGPESWEAVFLPDGARAGWGHWDAYTPEEQERFSMRRPTLAQLRAFLDA